MTEYLYTFFTSAIDAATNLQVLDSALRYLYKVLANINTT